MLNTLQGESWLFSNKNNLADAAVCCNHLDPIFHYCQAGELPWFLPRVGLKPAKNMLRRIETF